MSAATRSRSSSRPTPVRAARRRPGSRRRPGRRGAGRYGGRVVNLCLVSPYALHGEHPVADQVRGLATALSARGHRVTVLAPSPSSRALRSGRHRLRALADGDTDALRAASGEPLVVAVGPALPVRRGGRRGGAGIPVAAGANVALAVGEGGFDVVHVF